MDLKFYLSIIARRWQVILIVALATTGMVAFGSQFIPPNYQAEADLQVITPIAGSSGNTYHETSFANRLINTYAQIATSDQVMNELREKLGLEVLPAISVKIISDSEILKINVEGPDPSLVAKTANSLAELIISKQGEAAADNINQEELNILTSRRDTLVKELEQANQELGRLIDTSAQAIAELDLLDRKIRLKEESYKNMSLQSQLYLIQRGNVPHIITTEMDQLQKELDSLNQEYRDLSKKSNEYSQQIDLLKQTIQNNQNAYSDILNRYDSTMGSNLRQQRTQDIVLVSPATEPIKPTGVSRKLMIAFGMVLGFVAGVIVAFFYDGLDTRIFSREQLAQITSLPVLGDFPKLRGPKNLTASMLNERVAVHKDYWMLCTKLMAMLQDQAIKTILVTSANPMEGKSTVTAALALGLARNNKVLIVDADLRRPQQQKYYQLSGEQGLDTFLKDEKSKVADVIQKNVKPGIDVLPCMITYRDPTDLLKPSRLNMLLKGIDAYDVILFDTPALLVAPDAYALAKIVDCVIVTVKRGEITADNLHSVCDYLEAVGANLLGVIMNQVPTKATFDYYNRKAGWKARFIDLRGKSPFVSSKQVGR